MESNRRKSTLFAVVSVVAGVVVALGIAEAILRAFDIGYGTAPLNAHPVLHHVHPASYTFRVHHVSGEYGGHLVRYDEGGRTCDPHNAAVDTSRARFRAVFLGDSYVEATQMPYARSFVGLLQESAGPKAVLRNYGVSSYSPAHYLLQWRTQIRAFEPTHVFLVMFSNDIDSDAEAMAKAVRDEQGELVAIPGPGGGRLVQQLRKLYVARLVRRAQQQLRWWIYHDPEDAAYVVGGYVEQNPDISKQTSDLVETIADEVGRTGARFVMLTVPSRYRVAHPEETYTEPEHSRKWEKWARERGIDFVDLVDSFNASQRAGESPFLDVDGHFNETGHRLVAEAIRSAYPDVFDADRR